MTGDDFVTYAGDDEEPETIGLSGMKPEPRRAKQLSREDLDYLAQKMGYPDMRALQEEREAKARADYEAREKARIDAILAEQERVRTVEDQAINGALASGRMVVELAGTVQDAKTYQDIKCPICKKDIEWMRETLRLAVMRSSYYGEARRPEYVRSGIGGDGLRYDTIHTGNRGSGLTVYAPSHLMEGSVNCPQCLGGMEMRLECQCTVDGKPVKGPVAPSLSYHKEDSPALTNTRKNGPARR
jgi:hypothetical protein